MALAWKHKIYVHGVYASAKEVARLATGETFLGWQGKGPQGVGRGRWQPEDLALRPEVFLKGVDPERDRYGMRAALDQWLDLDHQGLMVTGSPVSGVRERFRAERAKY